jgi:type II secretory pathway component PulK
MSEPRKRERGIVLVMVLFFALLLVSSIATFLHRATVDTMGVRSRDAAQRAEALARGGVRLATALLLEDRVRESQLEFRAEGATDVWAQVGGQEIDMGNGATLTLDIADAGSRLNLNALFNAEGALEDTEVFLTEVFRKVIEEMHVRPEEKLYDPQELAQNLIDWVDPDDANPRGGLEDEPYQKQEPPYRAPNRPLLSVQELRLVEGFDAKLVEALEPYVDVHPLAGGLGINPNTAPTWVLALLFHRDDAIADQRLADEDLVADLADARKDAILCGEAGKEGQCLPMADVAQIDPKALFPAPTLESDVFHVRAEARIGEIQRRLDVVLDRSDPLADRAHAVSRPRGRAAADASARAGGGSRRRAARVPARLRAADRRGRLRASW